MQVGVVSFQFNKQMFTIVSVLVDGSVAVTKCTNERVLIHSIA